MREKYKLHDVLLDNIKDNLDELKEVRDEVLAKHSYEDYMYRYYHHSFKVYWLQSCSKQIFEMIQKIKPEKCEIDDEFMDIYLKGSNKSWEEGDNMRWYYEVSPILETFHHCRYFLDMMIKYGEMDEAPEILPSGWASVLYLYNIR